LAEHFSISNYRAPALATGPVHFLNGQGGAASNLRLTCLKFSVAGDGNAAEDFS
jgi:hypothetical protein